MPPAPAPAPPPLSHAHHTPPAHIRAVHKTYQKLPQPALSQDPRILDFAPGADTSRHAPHLQTVGRVPQDRAQRAFDAFRAAAGGGGGERAEAAGDVPIYEHALVPGLQLLPGLLPAAAQRTLLGALLHTHLSNPAHATNLHAHYTLPYPPSGGGGDSFFALPPEAPLAPHDPRAHAPTTARRMLARKLRWLTLGGQYDWTRKQYPPEGAAGPAFPPDLAALVTGLLPETLAPQAAIANVYSPGDTLAPHRDVSESSRAALVSVSVGCDALFVVGLDAGEEEEEREEGGVLVLRVRSGDVLVMGGAARWAWHSVPRVLAGTCPPGLAAWPGAPGGEWEGWLRGKRVNLNVRQMWDP